MATAEWLKSVMRYKAATATSYPYLKYQKDNHKSARDRIFVFPLEMAGGFPLKLKTMCFLFRCHLWILYYFASWFSNYLLLIFFISFLWWCSLPFELVSYCACMHFIRLPSHWFHFNLHFLAFCADFDQHFINYCKCMCEFDILIQVRCLQYLINALPTECLSFWERNTMTANTGNFYYRNKLKHSKVMSSNIYPVIIYLKFWHSFYFFFYLYITYLWVELTRYYAFFARKKLDMSERY